jgi:hypothetical protein
MRNPIHKVKSLLQKIFSLLVERTASKVLFAEDVLL